MQCRSVICGCLKCRVVGRCVLCVLDLRVIYLRSHRSHRNFIVGSLSWIAVGYLFAILPSLQTRDAVQATFVDVTHGTSVLMELPGGDRTCYTTVVAWAIFSRPVAVSMMFYGTGVYTRLVLCVVARR